MVSGFVAYDWQQISFILDTQNFCLFDFDK